MQVKFNHVHPYSFILRPYWNNLLCFYSFRFSIDLSSCTSHSHILCVIMHININGFFILCTFYHYSNGASILFISIIFNTRSFIQFNIKSCSLQRVSCNMSFLLCPILVTNTTSTRGFALTQPSIPMLKFSYLQCSYFPISFMLHSYLTTTVATPRWFDVTCYALIPVFLERKEKYDCWCIFHLLLPLDALYPKTRKKGWDAHLEAMQVTHRLSTPFCFP